MSTPLRRQRLAQSMSPGLRRKAASAAVSSYYPEDLLREESRRLVTPTAEKASTPPTWEDYDEGMYAAQQRRKRGQGLVRSNSEAWRKESPVSDDHSVRSMSRSIRSNSIESVESAPVSRGQIHRQHPPSNARPRTTAPSIGISRSFDAAPTSYSSSSAPSPKTSTTRVSQSSKTRPPRLSASSAGSTSPPPPSAVMRMRAMLLQQQSNSKNVSLSNLSAEEQALWETIQAVAVGSTRSKSSTDKQLEAAQAKIARLESQIREANKNDQRNSASSPRPPSPSTVHRLSELQAQVVDLQRARDEAKKESEQSIRAIQRVLADVSSEKEQEVNALETKVLELQQQLSSIGADAVPGSPEREGQRLLFAKKELMDLKKKYEKERVVAQKEMEIKNDKIARLEREARSLKLQQTKLGDDTVKHQKKFKTQVERVKQVEQELASTKDENKRLTSELEQLQVSGLRSTPALEVSPSGRNESEQMKSLKKELAETTQSLENAKKIIASLENANSSQAQEFRAKSRQSQMDLQRVQEESADRKKHLDRLATELRDLQNEHAKLQNSNSMAHVDWAMVRQQLERSVSELQSAAAVHEVSMSMGAVDEGNVDRISSILGDTLTALRDTLNGEAVRETSSQNDIRRHNTNPARETELRKEVDQQRKKIVQLEQTVHRQKQQLQDPNSSMSSSSSGDDSPENVRSLRREIHSLRNQCTKYMEILARKDRELSVLRSSLKVDEEDVGYISDDASDEDEDEDDSAAPSRMSQDSVRMFDSLKSQLDKARSEKETSARELKMERESLANAKMIISSLEKANKSMMEDLRSRLQDSNTAIASLLDKSMEHETTTTSLREELEKVKAERDMLKEERYKYNELSKLQEDNMALNLRMKGAALEEKKDDEAALLSSSFD